MDSCMDHRFFTCVVSQFGNLRIEAYLQLPAAYRSLSRPSSAPDAKAFTLCSFSLELRLAYIKDLCISFILHVIRIANSFLKFVIALFYHLPSSHSVWQNCSLTYPFRKDLCIITDTLIFRLFLSVRYLILLLFIRFSMIICKTFYRLLSQVNDFGGPEWSRTTDLAIISRVL